MNQSAVEADGRRVIAQKFAKLFTNQTLEPYSSHPARGVAECTSICNTDKMLGCQAFRMDESLSDVGGCLLYNSTTHILATNESSSNTTCVFVTRGKSNSIIACFYL